MNGPAYLILGMVAIAGILMLAAWRALYRRHPQRPARREQVLRGGVVIVWLAGLVIVPLVARPGSQPGWNLVAQFCVIVPMMCGIRDLKISRRRRGTAPGQPGSLIP